MLSRDAPLGTVLNGVFLCNCLCEKQSSSLPKSPLGNSLPSDSQRKTLGDFRTALDWTRGCASCGVENRRAAILRLYLDRLESIARIPILSSRPNQPIRAPVSRWRSCSGWLILAPRNDPCSFCRPPSFRVVTTRPQGGSSEVALRYVPMGPSLFVHFRSRLHDDPSHPSDR